MNKIKRDLNPLEYKESERRIIEGVFTHIEKMNVTSKTRRQKPSLILGSLFTVFAVVAFIVIQTLSPGTTPSGTTPIELTAFQNKKIAEIGYLSGSIIAASQTAPNASVIALPMANTTTSSTAFESNIDTINLYFDMLRVFLSDDPFSNDITVSDSTDSNYDTFITFQSNGFQYELKLKFTSETAITGILLFENREFTVQGTIENTSSHFTIELEASSSTNNDFVTIHYATENENEIETTYNITSSFDGIESSRTIRIENENNEAHVQMIENNNEYQLEKEIENNVTKYELQYNINGVEGAAVITEQLDQYGNITYLYQLSEGTYEEEFEHERPTYHSEDNPDPSSSYQAPTYRNLEVL